MLKDVVYRVAPFDIETAREMIGELRGARLFEGYRGQAAVDKEALAQALVALCRAWQRPWPRAWPSPTSTRIARPAGKGVAAADALVGLK